MVCLRRGIRSCNALGSPRATGADGAAPSRDRRGLGEAASNNRAPAGFTRGQTRGLDEATSNNRAPAGFTRGGRRSVDAAGTHTAKQRRVVGWFVCDAGSDLATHWVRHAQPAPTERRPPGINAASARPPTIGTRRVHAGPNPRPQRGHLQQQGTRRVHAGPNPRPRRGHLQQQGTRRVHSWRASLRRRRGDVAQWATGSL